MSEDIVSFDPLPSAKLELNDGTADAWEVFTSDEGELYYHNEATGETAWEKPSALAAATELLQEEDQAVEQRKYFALVGENAAHGANEEDKRTGSNEQSAEESKEISLAAFLRHHSKDS